ncbi:MAG TPA: YtxH domain-containing protein [Anaerolineales bacterium]|nr:YtxH domain-containing protein [Anaerolineales bacterium]
MRQFTSFIAGVLAGALVGGITALLIAPTSGEELRARTRERFNEVSDDLREAYSARVAQLEAEIARLRAGKTGETA